MWWVIALALSAPAQAQRPFCDFGQGVAALRQAQHSLAAPIPGLVAGREAAQAIADSLDTAHTAFTRCGCWHLAEMLPEPARMAESATSHSAVSQIRATLENTALHINLARQALDRRGCR